MMDVAKALAFMISGTRFAYIAWSAGYLMV